MGNAISVSLIVFISIAVIVFLISVIISIKFGKKTSFNAEHKDNSFGFSIESDNQISLEQKESKKEISETKQKSITTNKQNDVSIQDHLRIALFHTSYPS